VAAGNRKRADEPSSPSLKPVADPRRGDPDFELRSLRVFEAMRELRNISFRQLYVEIYGDADDALEPAQYEALEVLTSRTEWRMTDFARALQVEPSTATRMVDRLVKARVAIRGASKSDGRGIVVRASREGRLRRTRVMEGRREHMHEFLATFGDDEIDTLATLMERLADSIAEVADRRGAASAGKRIFEE
jgi:DNA-binding MarR family transcriptional regulator